MLNEIEWTLEVELDGEWEACSYTTPGEALNSFRALSTDYALVLSRAVLYSRPTGVVSAAQIRTALQGEDLFVYYGHPN